MEFDLTELPKLTNDCFFSLYTNQDRYLILWGGAGSGKSYFAAQKILVRILIGAEKNITHKFLCVRKTQPAVRKSVFELFREYIIKWRLQSICRINLTTMTISFNNGSQIICGGCDDPEKLKSIVGITGIWLEESTEMSFDDFTQIDLRLRGYTPTYKQIILSFNPIDANNWVKQRFQMPDSQLDATHRTSENTLLHHSTYKDNRFIDEEYKVILQNLVNQDENYYKIYNKGRWGVLKGLIYSNWDSVKKFPAELQLHGYGLDFGYSNHPTALIEIGFVDNSLYERQLLYEKGLTNPAICDKLQMLNVEGVICADCAEPKSIQEISNSGYNIIGCRKGADSIVHGIDTVKRYRVHIHEDSVDLIKEKETYKWAEDKDGNLLNKPVDFMNHLMDAERYIVTHFKGKTKVGLHFAPDSDKEKLIVPEADEMIIATQPDIDDETIWQEN